jgi:ABC-type hemin transport system ATPase subunit
VRKLLDTVERYASRVVAFCAGRVNADAAPQQALATDHVRCDVTGQLLPE